MLANVRLSEPRLMHELIAAFTQAGCLVHQTDESSCRVVYHHSVTPEEAHKELQFFVGAWQLAHPGVTSVVTSVA